MRMLPTPDQRKIMINLSVSKTADALVRETAIEDY